jgi:hypothetical protein
MRPNRFNKRDLTPDQARFLASLSKITLLCTPEMDPSFPDADFHDEDAFAFARVAIPGLFHNALTSEPTSPASSFDAQVSDSGVGFEDLKWTPVEEWAEDDTIADLHPRPTAPTPTPQPPRPSRGRSVTAPGNLDSSNGSLKRITGKNRRAFHL